MSDKTILKTIKFTIKEQEQLNELLEQSGLGFSALVKSRIFSKNSAKAIAIAQEKREQRAESLKPRDPQAQELLSELHKIGINLNQIARALNQKDISTLDKIALSIIGETNEQIKSIYSFLAQQKETQEQKEEPKNDTAIMTKAEIIRANILSRLVDSEDE